MLGDALALGLTDDDGETLGLAEADGLTLADGLIEGDSEAEGETLALGETLGDSDTEGDTDAEGLTDADGDTDGDAEALGDTDALGETLGLAEALGDTEADGETDAEGETEGDALADGLTDADGLIDGLALADGEILALGLTDSEGLTLGLALALGLTEADGLMDGDALALGETDAEGLTLGDALALGDTEAEGLTDALGETLGDADADGETDALGICGGERSIWTLRHWDETAMVTVEFPVVPASVFSPIATPKPPPAPALVVLSPLSVKLTRFPFVQTEKVAVLLASLVVAQMATTRQLSEGVVTASTVPLPVFAPFPVPTVQAVPVVTQPETTNMRALTWLPTPSMVTLASPAPALLPKTVRVVTPVAPAPCVSSKIFVQPEGVFGVPAAVVESVDSTTIRSMSSACGAPAPVGTAAVQLVVPEP